MVNTERLGANTLKPNDLVQPKPVDRDSWSLRGYSNATLAAVREARVTNAPILRRARRTALQTAQERLAKNGK